MPKKNGKMSEDLLKTIDQIAMQAMMVEADDVMTLGAILERIESVEKITLEKGPKTVGSLSGAIKNLVERLILGEIPDLPKGLELLGSGLRMIQEKISQHDPSKPLAGEDSFWKAMASMIQEKIAVVGSAEAPPAQPQEGSGDSGTDIQLFNDFISEALEHLDSIELNIINLEQFPEDRECINAIFRPFHTIKGVSGFLNLKEINKFSHAMESLLDDARNGRLRVHRGIIDFILGAVDLSRKMILELKEQIQSGPPRPSQWDYESYLQKINLIREEKSSGDPAPEKEVPEKIEPPPLGEILAQKGIVSPADIQDALRKQKETNQKLGEILIRENKAKPLEVVEALRDQKRAAGQLPETTVKVDTRKLDGLVDMVGELVITQSLVQQNPVFSSVRDLKLTRDFSQLQRITTDLQRISMSLRMIPIRQTFQKMIRLVRDLTRKSNKQVDLIMSGEETEIDRNMVDTLYEPLVHMIRNSIDHGIESPEKRRESGKSESGMIYLRAFQRSGYIVIEIEDDGQGLNRPKILKKAQEKGLVPSEASLTDYQIDNMIFEPGFSTADRVTDISGRGVGMDVVKKAITGLKGMVEIFSVAGKGCRFVIRVPITLAIMDGIVIQIGEERYIIPTVFIKETIRPSRNDLTTVHNKGEVIKVRDSLLPLVRLPQLLGAIPRKKEPWEALVVVVENEGHRKALMVDDLIGKQEVVIKNLGEGLKKVKGVAGATIMGDGRVGLILDIHNLFDLDPEPPSSAVYNARKLTPDI
jgi:two-component system chemotaxis sensor kinase CheA